MLTGVGSPAGATDLLVKPDANGILPFKLNAGRNIILGQPKRFKLDVSIDITGEYTYVSYMSVEYNLPTFVTSISQFNPHDASISEVNNLN